MNKAKVIEVTHTGLGTEHEYEKEVSEEHQYAGTEETLAFVHRCCPSERSRAQCNKEDEEKYSASARYQRKQITGLYASHGTDCSNNQRMYDDCQEAND